MIQEENESNVTITNDMNKNEDNKPLLICPECNKGIPNIALKNFNGQLFIQIKCLCHSDHKELSINDYLNKIEHSIPNEQCSLHHKETIKYCVDCIQWQCSDCLLSHSVTEKHLLLDYQFNLLCISHKKSYSYFCNQCHINICKYCLINHQSHSMIQLKEVDINHFEKDLQIISNQKKEEGYKLLRDINNQIKDLETQIQILNHKKMNIHNSLKSIEYLDELMKCLYLTGRKCLDYPCYELMNFCEKIYSINHIGTSKGITYTNTPTTITSSTHAPTPLQSLTISDTIDSPGESLGFLSNREDKIMIINWISKGRQIKFNLLYNPFKGIFGSEGIDTESECIKAFYNKAPLLILIRSNNGSKFGGYTSVGFDIPQNEDWKWKSDPNAFLFSIDKKKKYLIKKQRVDSAIHCTKGFIASFTSGLFLKKNFLTMNNNKTCMKYYGNNDPLYELNNGSESFSVSSLFVYSISYIDNNTKI